METKKMNYNFLMFLIIFMFMASSVYAAQSPVDLGTAGNFVILAKSGITTTGVTSIVGDIGVSPIDSTAITGFGLIMDPSNEFSTSSLISGNVYASDYTSPTPSLLTTAVSDMETAYTDAQGRTLPDATELGIGDISGMTLTPGLYTWSTGVLINSGGSPDASGVTLDCQGNSSAVFIFQIAQDLALGNGAQVTLIGNCQPQNLFWAVAQDVTLGTTSSFSGNVLAFNSGGALDSIALNSDSVVDGRLLSQKAVTLIGNAISLSAPIMDPTPSLNLSTTVTNDTVEAVCQTSNYSPITFYFDFGDGNLTTLYAPNNTVSHTYAANGNYTVSCAASDGASIFQNETIVVIDALSTPPSTPPSVSVQTTVTNATVEAVCEPTGFSPSTFDFNFGDGSPDVLDSTNNTATHTYTAAGEYTVYCSATENALTLANVSSVTINESSIPIIPTTPASFVSVQTTVTDATVEAVCEPTGFSPDTFDFDFGDGTQPTYDVTNNTLSHTYAASGNYTVSCAGTQDALTQMNSSTVSINSIAAPPYLINLYVKNPFPQGNNYTFVCDNTLTPDGYDWEIVNIATNVREYLQYDISNREIWHTMRQVGEYSVFCAVTQGSVTVSDSITITNTFTPPIQTQPGNFANTTVIDNTTTLIVPANANQDIRITVGIDIIQTSIDLTALFINTINGTRAFMPINAIFDVMTTNGLVNVQVPAGITISSTPEWDGILLLPQVTLATATLPDNATAGAVIEMGSNLSLTFDKGVRILFENRSSERVVYVKNGITTEITTLCAADTQLSADGLVPGGECRIAVGNDLVVWTKHFTEFVTYTTPSTTEPATTEPATSNSGGSSGGSSGGRRSGGSSGSGIDQTTLSETIVDGSVNSDPADGNGSTDASTSDDVNSDTTSDRGVPAQEEARVGSTQNNDASGITGLAIGNGTLQTASFPPWLMFASLGLLAAVVMGLLYFRSHTR